MKRALAGGLCQFNLESIEEARTLSDVARSLGQKEPAAFRINPAVEAGSPAKISTGAPHNQFVLPIPDALDAYRQGRGPHRRPVRGRAVPNCHPLTCLDPPKRP